MDQHIRRIANGDNEALKTLYDALYRPIYLFALSVVKDRQLAEDALQDTFLNVLRLADTYRQGTKPRAWIFTVARHASLAVLKKTAQPLLSLDEIAPTVSAPPDRESDDAFAALEAMSVLTPVEREIVALYVYAGFRQTEIAGILHMPYGEARAHYGYAMKKLKRYYSQQGGMSP